MQSRHWVCCLILVACWTSFAQADLNVSVGSLALAPGADGWLPVTISSTTGQTLNNTQFELLITTSGPTRLEFVTPPPTPAADQTFAAANYLFAGNSFDQTNNFSLGVIPNPGTTVPSDTFLGGDSSNDFTDVTLTSGGALLAMLHVTASTALLPVLGDTFTVTLIAGDNTSFFNNAGGPFEYSSSPGTVTIVPEPEAWQLGLLSLATILFAAWRRQRTCSSGVAR